MNERKNNQKNINKGIRAPIIKPLTEGYSVKGGQNTEFSFTKRPPPPPAIEPISKKKPKPSKASG